MRSNRRRHPVVLGLATAAAMLVNSGSGHGAEWVQHLKHQAKQVLAEAWYFGEDSLGLDLNHPHWQTPHVSWPTATPESVGLSTVGLDHLRSELEARHTMALLVARDGRLVYEWYGHTVGPNSLFGVAALGKAMVAGPLLLAEETDGRISLQERVAKLFPEWNKDARKSRITILNLATHSSGLEDVDWGTEEADAALHGWKKRYVEHPDDRFRMALDVAPVNFEPGAHYSYCGLGFYVLAYALTKSLDGTHYPNVKAYYRARIMRPLGIPDSDWQLNYGRVSHDGPTELYAIGSGESFTARTIARIGQLYLDHGEANGKPLLDARYVKTAMANAGLPPVTGGDGKPAPSPGVALWVNNPQVYPWLPEDAVIGAGAYHQILLVVPSLHLVAVRLGGPLGSDHWGGRFWTQLGERFFRPLMATLETPQNGHHFVGGTGPDAREQASASAKNQAQPAQPDPAAR